MLGQRCELEVQEFVDIKRSRAILAIEVIIAFRVPVGVNDFESYKEIGPRDITVNGQEGVIKIKECCLLYTSPSPRDRG